jgi:hypothetical protein
MQNLLEVPHPSHWSINLKELDLNAEIEFNIEVFDFEKFSQIKFYSS